MSINSEFVSAEVAAEMLGSYAVTEDKSFNALRVRRMRSPGGKEVLLVEGALGEYAVISH